MKKFLKMVLAVICGILLLNLLALAVFAGLAGGNKAPAVPSEGVLKIDMSRIVIAEQGGPADPLAMLQGGMQTVTLGLWDAVSAVNAAADDPGIKYIYLKPDGNSTPLATLSEFRKALANFRAKSGKAVVAYLEAPSTGSYYLSSVADKIYMTSHPGAPIQMTGIGSQMVFLGDLLSRLGVNVQLIRHGKYKSAGEMYTRSSSSPENREQYQVMVNSMWDTISEEIALSRGISVAELNDAVDNLKLCLSEDFLFCGLVDELLDRDGLKKQLATLAVEEKFSSVKMIPFADYTTAKIVPSTGKEKIAVIYADGEIIDGEAEQNVTGDRFASIIEKIREDKTVKAVVLRVNSPGGSVLASEKIKAELDRLGKEKPLVASYGNYAASGGYWISNNCDKIYSDAVTLTGSIGVFGMIPDFSKTASDLLHVGVESVTSNKHGDMFGLMRPFDKAEYNFMLRSIEDIYTRFTENVSAGRDLPVERVDEIGQGRVWTGRDALGLGLVDEIGTLEDAIAYAASLAGNEDVSAWNIKGYPAPQTTMEALMSSFNGPTEDYAVRLAKEVSKTGIYARLPYELKFIY